MLTRLATIDDLALALGLSPATVSRAWRSWADPAHAGYRGLPDPIMGQHKGGRPRWRMADVDQWLDRLASAPITGVANDRATPCAKPSLAQPTPRPLTLALLAAAGCD